MSRRGESGRTLKEKCPEVLTVPLSLKDIKKDGISIEKG